MTIYENLAKIAGRFDVFLFDAYGVFWNGSGFYKNSLETLQALVAAGKTVVVVSNATPLHDDMVQSYLRKGMQPGRDYTFMVSSGEVLRQDVQAGNLHFSLCANPRRCFTLGLPHTKMFADTVYQAVGQPEEADFVYCGVPFLTAADVALFPEYKDCFLPARADNDGHIIYWDTTVAEPFLPLVERIAALKLPVLNANPDYTAQEGHPLSGDSASCFVIRNGTTAEMLRRCGNEVLEYGKPHKNIYDYVFAKLHECGVKIEKSRICMIGDTVRTDIKGAVAAGIVPVLCMQTGVTAWEISKGNTVENLCEKEKIDIKQIIKINSVGGI